MTTLAVPEPRTHRLSRRVLLGYGIGSLGTGIYSSTPGVLLLFFMTDTLGIPASLAALGVSLPKFWDMIADPIVGGLSDRTRSRWGRRRPWLLGGSLLMLFSYIFLFTVPRFESTWASLVYVTGMFAVSATAYAIFAVPYTAMAAEMSDSSTERVRIMAYRMTLVLLGILAGSALAPMLVATLGGGRHGYAAMSIVVGSMAAGAMLLSFFSTRHVRLHEQPVLHVTWREQMRLVLRNRQFLCLLGVYLVQLLALGTMTAATPYFAVHVLGQDEGLIGRIFLVLMGVGVDLDAILVGDGTTVRQAARLRRGEPAVRGRQSLAACRPTGRRHGFALRPARVHGARLRCAAIAAVCDADGRDQCGRGRLVEYDAKASCPASGSQAKRRGWRSARCWLD